MGLRGLRRNNRRVIGLILVVLPVLAFAFIAGSYLRFRSVVIPVGTDLSQAVRPYSPGYVSIVESGEHRLLSREEYLTLLPGFSGTLTWHDELFMGLGGGRTIRLQCRNERVVRADVLFSPGT